MSDERPVILMTTEEVADLVRRKPATIRDWIKRGRLEPAGQLPDGAYLFDRADVLHFIGRGPCLPREARVTAKERAMMRRPCAAAGVTRSACGLCGNEVARWVDVCRTCRESVEREGRRTKPPRRATG